MLNSEPRLVLITAVHCSGFMRWSMASRVMPALLTSTSIGPSSASTFFTPSAQASNDDTSHLNTAMPVSALNFCAASSLPA